MGVYSDGAYASMPLVSLRNTCQSYLMLDEGLWAEIKVGGEHLRLFSERYALGVQTSVYNVNTKTWIAPSSRSRTSNRVKIERRPEQRRT
jgi:hypothetical protein